MILKLKLSKKPKTVAADCYAVQECDATGGAIKTKAGVKK